MLGISLYDVQNDPENFKSIIQKSSTESKVPLKFKFLLLDPKSNFLKQRGIEEDGRETGRLVRVCNETIKTLEQIKETISKMGVTNVEFEYRTYDALPTHSLIWADKTMFVGPYQRKRLGYETSWMWVPAKEEAYREYEEDFGQLWERLKELDLS